MNHTVRAVLDAASKFNAASSKPEEVQATGEFEKALHAWFLEAVRSNSDAIAKAAGEGNRRSSRLGAN